MTASPAPKMICLAEIVGAQGVRGQVKVKLFGDNPESLVEYSPLCDAKGAFLYTVEKLIPHGNIWLAALAGVSDRSAAEKLRGTKLYVSRDVLPDVEEDGTYYHADLVGLATKHIDGTDMGRIIAVANFGAGDLLEIKPPKGNSFYIPFTNEAVPEVSITKGTVTINPPPGLLD
ncbi:MAG: ribosome maturation factor RimM [Alphaproteobacteria bacterium]|nr:ribosome maturation factor RimM [Alphaproteobacteria bacterium]